MLVLVINFTSCKKLSQDVLQANGHLTKANKAYGKEKFKAAVKEYEEALKKNPELKELNLQLYIASCYSSLYKANVQPPENQELLNKIKESASVLYEMKKNIVAKSEDDETAVDPIVEFKDIVVKNTGQVGGLKIINSFLDDEEKGMTNLKELANKFIEKEKEIFAITNTLSPIEPEYRTKLEENEFNGLKIKELKEYIDSNSDAEDLDVKRGEIDNINAKIIENEIQIENTFVKNKEFYLKRKKNIELKKEIATGKEFVQSVPVGDIPVEEDIHGKVLKYSDIYDFIGSKIAENKMLTTDNREMKEYFSKKDEIEYKTTLLETKNQELTAMAGYEEVNSKIEKSKENNKEIIRLKAETIDLIEKKDDAEGFLITEYSEKYDVFSEKLFDDIESNKEVIKIHDFLKAVDGYEIVLNKITNDSNYMKLDEEIKVERVAISNNNKFLDTVKDLEDIKFKIREYDKYDKLLKESEVFLSSVTDLEQIVAKNEANEQLKTEFIAEQKKADEEEAGDVSGTLSRFGNFEYDNVDITKKIDESKKKTVLSEKGKELNGKIEINKKYFAKIKNFDKIIETSNQVENYRKTVKTNTEFLDKIENLEEVKVNVTKNQESSQNIEKKISEKKDIAKNYLKSLKNSKVVIEKFEKIINVQDKLLQNASFYAVSEGFSDFKIKFDEMIGFQNKIDNNGTVQELLTKEIAENDKILSENEEFKALSGLIHERANFEYKIKSNKEFIVKIEKKHKKGEVENTFDDLVVKFNADMKKITQNKAALDALNEKYSNILVKFNIHEAKIKEELSNKNYFVKAIKNEMYKSAAIKNLSDYIKNEENSDQDKRKALTLLSDIYKKVAQSASDDTTKDLFFEKTKACYEELLKEAGSDKEKSALALYSKAKFYSEFGKDAIAKQQYFDRIKLDPYAAGGYYFFANYLQERALYSEAIENHKKRIYALVDIANGNHMIMDEVIKIDGMREDLARIKNLEIYVERTGKYLKALDANLKKEYFEKKQELADIKLRKKENVDNFKVKLAEAFTAYKALDIKSLDKKLREDLAKAFYTVGVVYWTSTYRTAAEEMHPYYRLSIIKSGFNVLEESIRLDQNYPEPWSYKALLWVQMKKVHPQKKDEYTANNKEANKVFVRLIKKRAELKRFEEAQKKV